MSSAPAHVSTLSILFMCVTLLISFALPVGLAIRMKTRHKQAFSLIPLFAGVLGFFISQVIFRMPLIGAVLPLFGWYKALMQMQWPYVLFLSLTAGLVEEPARFIAFAIMKKRRTFIDGLAYGIGHGGIEAILLIGIPFIGNIVMSLLINTGAPASPQLPAQALDAITQAAPAIFLVSGIERIFAIALHLALSLVVLKGLQTGKKGLYLLTAIGLHGAVNFLALAAKTLGSKVMAANPQLGGVLFAEILLAIVAVLSVRYILQQAAEWHRSQETPAA